MLVHRMKNSERILHLIHLVGVRDVPCFRGFAAFQPHPLEHGSETPVKIKPLCTQIAS